MILEADNKGAIDWINSWSVSGCMRHIDLRHAFLRDMREDGMLTVNWIAGPDNSSDILTKSLLGPLFEKYASIFCGIDQYTQYESARGIGVGLDGIVPEINHFDPDNKEKNKKSKNKD